MKRMFLLFLTLILSLSFATCSFAEETGEYPETEIVQTLMNAIGEDLAERAKAAGFEMDFIFRHYKYAPPEGWEPAEGQNFEDQLLIAVEITTPSNTTSFSSFTLDCDTFRDLQYAVIDSGVFTLTEEEIAELKAHTYSNESRNHDVRAMDGLFCMSILDLPFGNASIIQMSILSRDQIHYIAHQNDWTHEYSWGELEQR